MRPVEPTPNQPAGPSGPALPAREAAELVAGIAEVTDSRLPLPDGLRALADEAPSRRLRAVYNDLAARVESGVMLEEALDELGNRVPSHLQGLVRAGVETGRLGEVVSEVARVQAHVRRLRSQVWQSLAYPTLLLVLLLGIVFVVKTFAVENLADLYREIAEQASRPNDRSLPLPMTMLLAMPSLDEPALWGFLAGLLILALSYRRLTSPAFRHRVLASLPIVGRIWGFGAVSELLRLLALLLEEKLPLPKALELTGEGLADRDLGRACQRVKVAVESGRSLPEAFGSERRLPRALGPLLDWGVQSGGLTPVLRTCADLYADRAEAQANLARTILPPLMFLIILAVVGALAYGMYSSVMRTIMYFVSW
jgi:type II secretory pathway component PulF